MAEDIFVGLDIGSYAVRVAVGTRIQGPDGRERLQLVGAVESPSEGVRRSSVTSMEDAVSSVSRAMEQAERVTGLPLTRAWVGISGFHVESQVSRGVVGVARNDGEIGEEDVERAVEAARTVAMPTNHEILHVIPKGFTVDGQRGVKDPVGMNGIRLEVDTLIIQGLTSHIKNLTKCVHRTGLEIEDLVFSVLAVAESVLTPRQKDIGVCVVNIGASTVGMAVYEEGELLHTAVLPIGSEHITSDIAIGLRTSLEVAEKVKIRYGTARPDDIAKKEDVNLADVGAGEEELVGRRFIAEIIEARVEEIFEKVDEELRRVERSGLLPSGIILTGGGAKLAGMGEVAKQRLRLPVSLGTPLGIVSVVDRAQDPAFATAIGLVLWGHRIRVSEGEGRFEQAFSVLKQASKLGVGMLKWAKSLKP